MELRDSLPNIPGSYIKYSADRLSAEVFCPVSPDGGIGDGFQVLRYESGIKFDLPIVPNWVFVGKYFEEVSL